MRYESDIGLEIMLSILLLSQQNTYADLEWPEFIDGSIRSFTGGTNYLSINDLDLLVNQAALMPFFANVETFQFKKVFCQITSTKAMLSNSVDTTISLWPSSFEELHPTNIAPHFV